MKQMLLLVKKIFKLQKNEIQKIQGNNIDWEYMKHLDLEIGAAAKYQELWKILDLIMDILKTSKEKTKSENETIEKRIWNKDSGEGSANVMTSLFPSSSGSLSSEGTSNDCFQKHVTQVLNLWHN